MSSHKNNNLVIVGGQWGDEGKGRVVDVIAQNFDIVVRFQGGNNAGHTLQIGNTSLVLHLLPCGIMRPEKISMIGNGVVIDLEILLQEIKKIKLLGIPIGPNNLRVSSLAHIILPVHKEIDAFKESELRAKIGTTKRGIGPCYQDKVGRLGIRAGDLKCKNLLREKIDNLYEINYENKIFMSTSKKLLFDRLLVWADLVVPYLADISFELCEKLEQGKRVLFEGAQGSLLDIDHGTYPFVTSSNCVSAQAAIGSGVSPRILNQIILVSKSYCTRVGEGPFFSEMPSTLQEKYRLCGGEFGATTGRSRRCGWLDLEALKHAVRINGATGIILTKVDILAQMGEVTICRGYKNIENKLLRFSEALDIHSRGEKIEPVLETLGEVRSWPDKINNFADFPQAIKNLIRLVAAELKIPVCMATYGPKRGQEIWC